MNLEQSLIRIDKLKIHDDTISEQERLKQAIEEHSKKVESRKAARFGSIYKQKRKKKNKLAKKQRRNAREKK